MRRDNSIYSIFVLVALIFWNPLSFYLLYDSKDIPIKHYYLFSVMIWLFFVLGLVIIYLILNRRTNLRINNLIFSISSALIILGVLVLTNAIIGLSYWKSASDDIIKKGLIFPPNTIARYSTVEFDYEARINSIGLRDHEVSIDKGNSFRVLCIGDSWTYGWGVDLEYSWPKQLELYLHEYGHKYVEVINVGQGGQYSSTYKLHMGNVVPLLKPDLVLVGVLQGDDFNQLYRNNYPIVRNRSIKLSDLCVSNLTKFIKNILGASFGNIVNYLTRNSTLRVERQWKESVRNTIESFSRQQYLNYETLDDDVKKLFENGNLNPGLLNGYVNNPTLGITINQPNNIATRFAKLELQKDFKDMKMIADKHNTTLVFVNLPSSGYTGHKVIRTPVSKIFNEYLYYNNIIDSIYCSVATMYDLPYIQLTEHFKALEDKEKYFFRYDGHPNEKGYKEIAIHIGQQLIKKDLLKRKE